MTLESAIGYIGGVLQIGGVVAVVLGIERNRSYLRGNPPILSRTWRRTKATARRAWRFLRRTPLEPIEIHTGSGTIRVVADAVGEGEAPVKGLDVPAALEALEHRIKELRKHVDKGDRELGERIEQSSRSLADQIAARVDRLRSEIHELTVGGSSLQLWGATAFILGITFQTFNVQVADLVGTMHRLPRPWMLSRL